MSNSNTSPACSAFPQWAAAVGGLVAIGLHALLGTLASSLYQRWLMLDGLSPQDAYAHLMAGESLAWSCVGVVLQLVPGLIGGYVAALYGDRAHCLRSGVIAGAISLSFVAAVGLNPAADFGSFWQALAHIVLPPATCVLGAYFCRWRMRAR